MAHLAAVDEETKHEGKMSGERRSCSHSRAGDKRENSTSEMSDHGRQTRGKRMRRGRKVPQSSVTAGRALRPPAACAKKVFPLVLCVTDCLLPNRSRPQQLHPRRRRHRREQRWFQRTRRVSGRCCWLPRRCCCWCVPSFWTLVPPFVCVAPPPLSRALAAFWHCSSARASKVSYELHPWPPCAAR